MHHLLTTGAYSHPHTTTTTSSSSITAAATMQVQCSRQFTCHQLLLVQQ
jgi:hypothetical protein